MYSGTFRLDLGPLVPVSKSLKQIRFNGKNGLSCRMSTMDFGRISIECFDDIAMLDTMDAIENTTPLSFLLSPKPDSSKLVFELINEKPENGLLSLPIRSLYKNSCLFKALAVHGPLSGYKKNDNIWFLYMQIHSYYVFLILYGKAAQKFEFVLPSIKACPWILVSGYGGILSPNKYRSFYSFFINNVLFLSEATSEKPVFGQADPEIMAQIETGF